MQYTDYYDLLERYSIMTNGGTMKTAETLEYLRDKTTPELFAKLQEENPATEINVDDTLNKYIFSNIGLYPCNESARPLCKIYDDQHNPIKENIIKDVETLQRWKQKNVSLFAFYPANNDYIVLDLDNSSEHANTTNGIENFKNLIAGVEMPTNYKALFFDFPKCFPCYAETPHNGIHLYFKNKYIPKSWNANTTELNKLNIEIKYNTQVTAAGSKRNGKEYILKGDLNDAPIMPPALIDILTKAKPQPIKPPANNNYIPTNGDKWNTTPDGIITKGNEKYFNDTPHYFILHTAVLFKNAGFPKETAIEYLQQTPQHLGRKDRNDTITTINSVYKGR